MKITLLFTLITISFGGFAQCPPPTNLTISISNPTSAQLSWTENPTISTWEVAVFPNFAIGATLPPNGIITLSNSYLVTNLPPTYGCYAFFVRSVCSATEVSPWVAVATSGCSIEIGDYLETLSAESFSEKSALTIFPNPVKKLFQIKSESDIEKIRIIDSLGKVILVQTQNNTEIDVEHLANGIYTVEIISENEKVFRRFIKE